MKHNSRHNLFGWLAASALLLTTACANDAMLDLSQGSGTRTVALTVLPQTQTSITRADGIMTGNSTISTGSLIDVLVYAVYEKQDGETYELINKEFKSTKVPDKISEDELGDGQTAVAATGTDMVNTPVKVQVTVDTEKDYKVVFWAQSSATTAFDTQDLKKVQVKYENALNNDEQRDAFCAVAEIIQGTPANEGKVYLRRPLAQVNVGTAGWDYEGAAYLKPSSVSYTKSTITLEGVAQYYNVLDGKTLSNGELAEGEKATTTAIFDYYRLPAFIKVDESEWNAPQIEPYAKEEYLRVDINKNGEFAPGYVGWKEFDSYRKAADTKAAYEKGKLPDTEEFKYLSMCYVLVPEATNITDKVKPDAKYGSVLDKVSFTAQGTVVDKNEPLEKKVEVSNVPVQKNWRTNILGYNFFLGAQKYIIDIVPDYCGDYNYDYNYDYNDNDETNGNEWPGVSRIYEMDFNVANENGNSTLPENGQISGYERGQLADFFNVTIWDYPNAQEKDTGKRNWHKHTQYDVTYNGKTYKYGLEMMACTAIEFNVDVSATLTIVQETTTTTSEIKLPGLRLWKEGSGNDDGEDLTTASATTPNDSNNKNVGLLDILSDENALKNFY